MPKQIALAATIYLLVATIGCHQPLKVVTSGCVETKVALTTDNAAAPLCASLLPGARCDTDCKIAVLDVDGLLVNRNLSGLGSMGENPVAVFREKLEAAAADGCVKAVVLRINSPGGGVTAADMMRQDLVQFKQRTNIPVVACLMDVGAGGAYYLATAADAIVAHPTTITGGMGVILNLYNLHDTMNQFNVLAVPIKAGEQIDLGSPVRPATPESRALLQHIADEFLTRYRDTVKSSRTLSADADSLFDGRIFTAGEAQRYGLIDSIGYLDSAIEQAHALAGDGGRGNLVMFRRANDRALSPYDITPNIPLQNGLLPVSLPGLDRSQLPTFLYLWQPEPLLEKTGGN